MSHTFSFMFDSRFRRLVERDYSELQSLDVETHSKATILLSGSIIEGILCDALVASNTRVFEYAVNQNLGSMIKDSVQAGILRDEYLSQVVRLSRNLIHPGLEIREKISFDSSDAAIAKPAVDVIIRDVSEWSRRFLQRRDLRKRLESLSDAEKELLLVFSEEPRVDSEFQHERLSNLAYRSIAQLEIDGILSISGEYRVNDSIKQTVKMSPELVEVYNEVFLSYPIRRQSVELSLRNVEASGVSGSGATGSIRL